MKKIMYILLFICAGVAAFAQSPKGKYGTFVLTNATIETVTKGTIANGTVIISNGKITYVGAATTAPQGAEVIDCKGKWIYPGFIDGGTNLGLSEVGSDQRTRDLNEIGEVIPQMQALTAVNPNSVLIPVTRVNGVTTVLTAPVGGMFPGTAALINLHGYTPDQMYVNFKGVVVNFPSTGRRGGFDRRTDDEIKTASEKAMKKLNEVFDRAIQYHKLDSATKSKGVEYYPEMEAMLGVVRGERAILLEVNAAKDILEALKWIKERKLKNVVLTGCREGWRVAADLAKAGFPVITGPVLALPSRDYDRYDKAYANPGLMKKAGVKVALRTSETENVRNLLFNAGFAAAYGMGREEALKAVTIVPAEIFGVSDKLGSIEVGKMANIVVSDGDPFETKTNIVHVFIDGWQIPMVSRHTQLYDEFLKREPGVNKSQK
ncbi:MAG TPA: amidohydrolase family protein [Cyclobacteriaceae bacterium]|nr:amidohydrolase family protein [Cyclobacteriaceae bacterium]HMV10351.1 amidohydrolase family protein [Cyclobacteriaceae bacterium]HMV89493.1 amidohydrolase family protein [Cyclobacteriaceae bacterium]HMX02742.1 amidohydrolase family protein [Cyclobacteriaceae bacterium]HMX50104.1 amidohydrolase family protein [Cyclobacteriaceae bacterium]